MKKLFAFLGAIYLLCSMFVIPYLFLVYTDASMTNLFCMSCLFTMATFGFYVYASAFIKLIKK